MQKSTHFILVFMFFSFAIHAQLEKGMMSFQNNFVRVGIQDFDVYGYLSPSLNYVVNDSWTVGVKPNFDFDRFAENKSRARGLETTIRFFVTPKLKRKIFLEESFSFDNSILEAIGEPKVTTNNSNIRLGVGMYRFLNQNVAFHHNLTWSYGFYAQRRNDKPFGNEFYKYKVAYQLSLQNFANFSKRDTIREKPFETGRIMTDLNFGYRNTKEIRYAFNLSGFYGVFAIDNLLLGIGGSASGYGFRLNPTIRYYVPLTRKVAIYADTDVTLAYQFLAKESSAFLDTGLGAHYLFNENVGAEIDFFYEKDIFATNSTDKYYGIKSGIKYYFK